MGYSSDDSDEVGIYQQHTEQCGKESRVGKLECMSMQGPTLFLFITLL